MLYGSESCAFKEQHKDKMRVVEMRMLRWMCSYTIKYMIHNDHIQKRVGVTPIVKKMVENRLRWFDHVQRRQLDAPVRIVDQMTLDDSYSWHHLVGITCVCYWN